VASPTGRLGHFWKAEAGQFWRAPKDIQEEILFLPAAEAREQGISEPSLRKLTATLLWSQQREQWRSLRRSTRNRAQPGGTDRTGSPVQAF
jgi:hypothetical protein